MQAPQKFSQFAHKPWIAQIAGRARAARQPAGHEHSAADIGENHFRADPKAFDGTQGLLLRRAAEAKQPNRRSIQPNDQPLLSPYGQPGLIPSPSAGEPADELKAPEFGVFRSQTSRVHAGIALRQDR